MWLLEHPPVITTGRRSVGGDVEPSRVRAAGFELHETERGGLATCHEPGQLVGYLFFDASAVGVHRTVAALEEGLIGWLRGEGIAAARREGYPGVWVGREKVAAIGLHFRRGVSMHGFALNLVNDLRGFALIVPCGLADAGVTTVARLTGRHLPPARVAAAVGDRILAALLDTRAGSP